MDNWKISDFSSTRTSVDGQYIVVDGGYKSEPFTDEDTAWSDALSDANTCMEDENCSGEVEIIDGEGTILWSAKDSPDIM